MKIKTPESFGLIKCVVFKDTGALDRVDQVSLVNLEIVEDKDPLQERCASGGDVFGEVLDEECEKASHPGSQEALANIEELLEKKMQKSDFSTSKSIIYL